MNKNYNNLLIGGICATILGIALLYYSVRSYSEIKYLNNKIDFDELDNNNHIPTSDKYYKHLTIGDFLMQKLEKNKNLPIKNTSCAYLDYYQHNIMSLYRLIYKTSNEDSSRKAVVEGNIRSYLLLMDNYRTCRKFGEYKAELQSKLEEIERADNSMIESRMDAFLNSRRIQNNDMNAEGEGMQPLYDSQTGQPVEPQAVQQQPPVQLPVQSDQSQNNVQNSEELIQPYLQ